MVILSLTCANEGEADIITTELLKQKLVACVHKQLITSTYRWDGEIHNGQEVLLTMESAASKFDAVEKLVRKHHSYDTFVLIATPVTQTSAGVNAWLNRSLQ